MNLETLVQTLDPGARLLGHWPLTGGVSAQTFALEIERDNGSTQRLVVRAHGARDIARDPDIARHEFKLLEALHEAGLPVPEPIYVDHSGEISGIPAVVTGFIDGDIRTVDRQSLTSRAVSEMAHWLSRIHTIDLTRTDLSFLVEIEYGNPERFQTRPADSELAEQICQVLNNTTPARRLNKPALLHGDYWPGNLLWDGDRIVGIIDWEDAFIGDPVIDLSRTRLELFWTEGFLASERFTAQYLGWNDIVIDDLPWWDLAMSIEFARALPEWGVSEETEQRMHGLLERFVDQAVGSWRNRSDRSTP